MTVDAQFGKAVLQFCNMSDDLYMGFDLSTQQLKGEYKIAPFLALVVQNVIRREQQ